MKTDLLKVRLKKVQTVLKRVGAAGTMADVLSLLGLDSVAGYLKLVALGAMVLLALVDVLLALLAKLLKTAGKLLLRHLVKLAIGTVSTLLCFSLSRPTAQFDINPSEGLMY